MKNCIVVLNYNDSDRTLKFVDDIKKYKIIDEIVVVDNCSTDDSYKKLKKIENDKITVIKTKENKGYGAGNNFGCKYAIKKYKDPIVFISNPDIIVEEKTMCDMVKHLKSNADVAVVAPNVYQDGQIERGWKLLSPMKGATLYLPLAYRILRKKQNTNYFYNDNHYNEKASIVDAVTGCFFAIKGSLMHKVGYYDEEVFLYNEEEILAKKIKKAGYKTVVLNEISVIHEHSVSISKSFSNINKIKIANKSKIYYQREYNGANKFEIMIWKCVNVVSVFKEYVKIAFNKIKGGN